MIELTGEQGHDVAVVKCALISEGLCPECKGQLVVPDRLLGRHLDAPGRWGVCMSCRVAHRASGQGDVSWSWESRMVDHHSLDPLGSS